MLNFIYRKEIKISLILLISGIYLFISKDIPSYLDADSSEYLKVAEGILNFDIFRKVTPEMSRAFSVRPPFYPFFISIFNIFNIASIHIIHSCLGIFCLLLLLITTNSIVNIKVLFLTIFGYFILIAKFQELLGTEWISSLLLLLLMFSFYINEVTQSKNYFYVSLVISCLILTKPVFLFLLFYPLFLYIFDKKKVLVRSSLLGFIPVLLWMTINIYRLDSFSVATYSGSAFLVIASIIGDAKSAPSDPDNVKNFFKDFNNKKLNNSNLDFKSSSKVLAATPLFEMYVKNLGIAQDIAQAQTLSYPNADNLFKLYAFRSIIKNYKVYINHLLNSSFILLADFIFLLLIYTIFRHFLKIDKGIKTFILISFLHLGHLFTVSLTQQIIPRYYLLSLNIVLCVIFFNILLKTEMLLCKSPVKRK